MISINKATEKDVTRIANIGKISVEEAHRNSCSDEDMKEFLEKTYNDIEIKTELSNPNNIYHTLSYDGKIVGFSKIVFNAEHPNIFHKNAAKLDRIYLLKEFYDLKLGSELLKFNIEMAKKHNQSHIWLFAWVGNTRAINFYLKAGFKIIGSHKFKVTETHYNEHHQMILDLSIF